MHEHCASMLCLIINRPSHRPMNIYMQSVPGSRVCAGGVESGIGWGGGMFIPLNSQTLVGSRISPATMRKESLKRREHFICCCSV